MIKVDACVSNVTVFNNEHPLKEEPAEESPILLQYNGIRTLVMSLFKKALSLIVTRLTEGCIAIDPPLAEPEVVRAGAIFGIFTTGLLNTVKPVKPPIELPA